MGLRKSTAVALAFAATATMASATAAVADSSDDFAYMFEATLNEGVTIEDMTTIIEEGAARLATEAGLTVDAPKGLIDEITGLVENPMSSSMADLRELPQQDQLMTLECSGNGASKGDLSRSFGIGDGGEFNCSCE